MSYSFEIRGDLGFDPGLFSFGTAQANPRVRLGGLWPRHPSRWSDVRCWHLADIGSDAEHVRSWG